MIYVISTLAALRSERFQECKSTPTDRPSLRLQFSCTSSFRDGLQVDKTMRLVIIQDISPLRAYQRTNSHCLPKDLPNLWQIQRHGGKVVRLCRGCVFRIEVNDDHEVDLWSGLSRDTYALDMSTEDTRCSGSGARLCSCGLGLVSFSPTIGVFH